MVDETENLTVRLLQEMRGDMRDLRTDIADIRSDIADIRQRVDGNTLLLNLVTGVLPDHEHRIVTLETRAS